MISANDHAYIKALERMVEYLEDVLDDNGIEPQDAGPPRLKLKGLSEKFEAEHKDDMWVVAFYNQGMDQGTELLRRQLEPNEIMDAEVFAKKIADDHDTELAEPDGYIPNCCGDIRVEFRKDPDNGVSIWSGQSFYFKREG